MRFAFIFLALIFSFSVMAWASQNETPAEGVPPTPETPLEKFKEWVEPGTIKTFIELPLYSFYLGKPDVSHGVAYLPNSALRLGTNIFWKSLALVLSVALPIPKEEIDRRGNSDQFNLILEKYWRDYGVSAYYQNYRGFYISNPVSELDFHKPDRFSQLPDAESKSYGVNFYKTLDDLSYSLKAGFAQKEVQNESGGSYLLTAFYNHLELNLGNKFIPGSSTDTPQIAPSLKSVRLDTIGGGGGYGYTWVFEKFFITAQGTANVGIQNQIVKSNSVDDQSVAPAFKVNAQLSTGYYFENSILGIQALGDTTFSTTKEVDIYSTVLNAYLYYSYRF